jgi:hypothetical protein
MKRRLYGIFTFFVITLTSVLATADVITVRQDGSGDHLTIAEAVAAAAAEDTIEVGPGTYPEPAIVLNHSLTFLSTDGAAATTVDGQDLVRILEVNSSGTSATVDGFRFVNGAGWGGAMTILYSARATIRNSVFESHENAVVIGLNGNAVFEDCTFRNNSAPISGSAIYVSGYGARAEVYNTLFDGNSAGDYGGAVNPMGGAYLKAVDCVFTNNSAFWGGAGGVGEESTGDFEGCLFWGNSGGEGGALEYRNPSSGTVTGSTFHANATTTANAAVVAGTGTVTRNIFSSQVNGYGLEVAASTTHSCNVFWHNDLGSILGGALGPDDVLADPVFCDASAGDFTISEHSPAAPDNSPCSLLIGALPVACDIVPSPSGVITVRQDGSGDYLTIAEAVTAAVENDTIEVGPGTYLEPAMIVNHSLTFLSTDGAAATTVDGQDLVRILELNNSWTDVTVDGFRFINGAGWGGGMTILSNARATIRNSVFENHENAIVVGGDCVITVEDCTFRNNAAPVSAPALYVSGSGARAEVYNTLFEGNNAGEYAGSVNPVNGAHLNVVDCVFKNNSAFYGGAAHIGEGSSADFEGCLFWGNSAAEGAALFYTDLTYGVVTANTFHANVTTTSSATVVAYSGPVTRNIFSAQDNGYGLAITSSATHSCNVFWGNELGPILGDALDPDDVLADPVFCDASAGDFTISEHSPAAPANSPCGLIIGALPIACDIPPPPGPVEEPVIAHILDVGNDQGRQIRITWLRSLYDAPATGTDITGYAVYRRQDAFATSEGTDQQKTSDLPTRASFLGGWDYIVTVPARGDSLYQVVAPTLCDSTKKNLCWSVFFVSAMTPDPLVFFDSAPDSGYSIDNIKPRCPENFSVAYGSGGGNDLSWTPADDPDFVSCQVYRGTSEDFATGPGNLLHVTAAEQWTDASGGLEHHYKITAMDDAGNESDPASPTMITGAERPPIPERYALYQNEPNPFNPTTVIRYDVPAGGGHITLEVYDVAGRLVRTLIDSAHTAGEKRVTWDGRDNRGDSAASGVYFYRLKTPTYVKTLKMALLR